ncbi:MAG TPA: hypothetical protein VH601_11635 [Bryobacteraceae bacterium]|jgi:hypothetical protein
MTVRRLYWLTAAFGLIGFVSYFALLGPVPAVAFLLGATGSFGNLWLFDWLSRAIAPGTTSRKPWQAGVFVTRYLLFFATGYVIVKALDVNPLPVIFGLLASTAAVLMSSILELFASLLGSRSSR